jgi:hypothetical protein
MNFVKVLGEIMKWAPLLEALRGMFGDPDEALKKIRAWELAERAKTDEMLKRRRERDDS